MSKPNRTDSLLHHSLCLQGIEYFGMGSIFLFLIGSSLKVLALFIASYSIGQYLSAPILNKLSKRFGRDLLLIGTMFGSIIGLAICSIGIHLEFAELTVAGRFFWGLMGANSSLCYAIISDHGDESSRTINQTWIPLSTSFGFVSGVLLIGLIGESISAVLLGISGIAFILNCRLAFVYLRDHSNRDHASMQIQQPHLLPLFVSLALISVNFFLASYTESYGLAICLFGWLYINCSISSQFGCVFTSHINNSYHFFVWCPGALAICLLALSSAQNLLLPDAILAVMICSVAITYSNIYTYLYFQIKTDKEPLISLAEFLPTILLIFFSYTNVMPPELTIAMGCLLGISLFLLPKNRALLNN